MIRVPFFDKVGQPLGGCGGFSGATLWRVEDQSGIWCLKRWPQGPMTPARLQWIHHLLGVAADLDFIPRLRRTASGATVVLHDNSLWDACSWQPGSADFHDHPSEERCRSACVALARLHRAWQSDSAARGVCPGVLRRLDALQACGSLLRSGWQPTLARDDPVSPWTTRAWQLLPSCVPVAKADLAAWLNIELPLLPCWCDPWHDHVLFTGNEVTGLIDHGSVKIDHPAVDLARLLASLLGNDTKGWDIGLSAYRSIRSLSEREVLLTSVLDRTGLIVAAVNWVRWLGLEKRTYENRAAVAERLQGIVERMDHAAIRPLPV